MDRDSLVTAPQSVKHAGTTGVQRGPSEAGVFLAGYGLGLSNGPATEAR